MKIHGVGQISISVTDVDRAVEFYRDTLGIDFLFQVPGTNPMAFFNCAGTRLYINQPENPEHATGSSVIYFTVDSAHEAAEELKSKGVQLESEPHIIHQTENFTLWMAFFKDPDGNLMSLMSEEGDLMG
ncbi:MAG: VOC family protein [Chloroflexi bacterium]|nr:VOC family protein [Chloroflexota bacterium]MYK61837.1 VOC family protein [Chloroflexota bacterium]